MLCSQLLAPRMSDFCHGDVVIRIVTLALLEINTDLVLQVIEYLSKKGYSKTEQMLRTESGANQEVENPLLAAGNADPEGPKFMKAFGKTAISLFFHTYRPRGNTDK